MDPRRVHTTTIAAFVAVDDPVCSDRLDDGANAAGTAEHPEVERHALRDMRIINRTR